MSIKLLVADDNELIRESLKIILSSDRDIEVVSVVENGKEAVEYCVNNKIDIALLDIRMPLVNGVEATREIVKRSSSTVIILTTFDEDNYIKEALNYGAKGYLLKNTAPSRIIESIKVVHNGSCVVGPEILSKITENLTVAKEIEDSKIDFNIFTEREIEVMESIADGLNNKDISKKLYISEGTVKNYITSILAKLDLEHRTQIAIYYLKRKK